MSTSNIPIKVLHWNLFGIGAVDCVRWHIAELGLWAIRAIFKTHFLFFEAFKVQPLACITTEKAWIKKAHALKYISSSKHG